MSHDPRYAEDLPRLAAEAYELSGRLCGTCRDMHALWTYIRLSRASTGVSRRAGSAHRGIEDAPRKSADDIE